MYYYSSAVLPLTIAVAAIFVLVIVVCRYRRDNQGHIQHRSTPSPGSYGNHTVHL